MPKFHILTPEELAARDAAQRSKPARSRAADQEQKPAPLPLDVQARMAYEAEEDPARRWLAAFKVAIKGNIAPSEAARLANSVGQEMAKVEPVVKEQGLVQ
jgi:hypothetical protein